MVRNKRGVKEGKTQIRLRSKGGRKERKGGREVGKKAEDQKK